MMITLRTKHVCNYGSSHAVPILLNLSVLLLFLPVAVVVAGPSFSHFLLPTLYQLHSTALPLTLPDQKTVLLHPGNPTIVS